MHIHLPKPLHGWREFVGEVGIIVIGVLIALGAEQLVEWVHWQHEVEETRDALRTELSRAAGSYQFNLSRQGCADRRLDDIERWLDHSHEGDRPDFARPIGGPSGYGILTGAWEVAKSGQAAWRMPLKERLLLAHLYGALQRYDEVSQSDNQLWKALDAYTAAEPVDHQDRVRMRGLIAQARREGALKRSYAHFIMPDVATLQVTPEKRAASDPAADRSFCAPLTVGRPA